MPIVNATRGPAPPIATQPRASGRRKATRLRRAAVRSRIAGLTRRLDRVRMSGADRACGICKTGRSNHDYGIERLRHRCSISNPDLSSATNSPRTGSCETGLARPCQAGARGAGRAQSAPTATRAFGDRIDSNPAAKASARPYPAHSLTHDVPKPRSIRSSGSPEIPRSSSASGDQRGPAGYRQRNVPSMLPLKTISGLQYRIAGPPASGHRNRHGRLSGPLNFSDPTSVFQRMGSCALAVAPVGMDFDEDGAYAASKASGENARCQRLRLKIMTFDDVRRLALSSQYHVDSTGYRSRADQPLKVLFSRKCWHSPERRRR